MGILCEISADFAEFLRIWVSWHQYESIWSKSQKFCFRIWKNSDENRDIPSNFQQIPLKFRRKIPEICQVPFFQKSGLWSTKNSRTHQTNCKFRVYSTEPQKLEKSANLFYLERSHEKHIFRMGPEPVGPIGFHLDPWPCAWTPNKALAQLAIQSLPC